MPDEHAPDQVRADPGWDELRDRPVHVGRPAVTALVVAIATAVVVGVAVGVALALI